VRAGPDDSLSQKTFDKSVQNHTDVSMCDPPSRKRV
jgi:hypothetical protein